MTTVDLLSLPTQADREDLSEGLLVLDGSSEWVDGELVEKPALGKKSGDAAALIFVRLFTYAQAKQLGNAVFEVSFQCFPAKPKQVRRPDIAFVAADRWAKVPEEGHVAIPPDLAVEVVSPGDNVYDLDDKLLDYQSVGVPLVWVVNPAARTVRVIRPDGSSRTLRESDTLDGSDVLPGFAVVFKDLLPGNGDRHQ